MYKLYTWKTPNGYKVPILLEELGAQYELVAINIVAGDQKAPEYLALNPNGKIPTLADGTVTLFESGAILMYLAEKEGKFLGEKYATLEWLMFQMAGVGPMFGQANFFIKFAKEKIPFAIDRYLQESLRLCAVMDRRLGESAYLAGEYSIADMATWPWVRTAQDPAYIHIDLQKFPNLKRWYDDIAKRPAVVAALKKVDDAAALKQSA